MPNPRQARRIVRDRQPDRPGRMWFKPYYGIEAERVDAIGDYAPRRSSRPRSASRSHWRFCAMGKSVCRGVRSVIVLCKPPRTAYGFNPGILSNRPRGPDVAPQRGNVHQDGDAFCWIEWSYVEPQRKVAKLERSRERLASNTSPLVEGDKGFRDLFEEGSFARKAGQMVHR